MTILRGFYRMFDEWYSFYAEQGEFVPQLVAQIP
jgi:hypothetical protein